MKSYLIKFMLSVVLMLQLFISPKAEAQTTVGVWSLSASNSVTNLLIGAGWNIKRVTLLCAAGTLPAGLFYDYNTNLANPFSSLQYSNTTGFSNLVSSANFTNTIVFTNSLGRTDTNRYVGISNSWVYVPPGTASNAIPIGAIAVTAGTAYTVDVNWNITQGLTFRGTNNANGTTIIVEYQ